jgi:WD40 repeat protein
MALAAGVRLGPYEILGLLGAGGMGEVYRARDPRLGRDVAVKALPGDVVSDPGRLRRFEQEARAVAALNHPNILTVFDVGTTGPPPPVSAEAGATTAGTCTAGPTASRAAVAAGIAYVVTELLEGQTLREFVSHRAPTQHQVLCFALQTARGLEAAHAKGIIHRDVKPENLFVTTDGRVKVLDFGLAKLTAPQARDSAEPTESKPTRAGQLLGTLGYMSPEQARGLPLDPRTDVFSLGVVPYELLGGKHPFRRDTAVATLSAILEETPPDLSSTARHVSPQVAAIVRRCLEKPREERFASAHDLVVALEALTAAGVSPLGVSAAEAGAERSPYPGLHSFTEADAARFFGREDEIEALWMKLRERRVLAVIGPSGTGKTSFVRAGVVAARPREWSVLVCTPGAQPLRRLGQALAVELSGDAWALPRLVAFEEPETAFELLVRWRRAHAEALLVVDQFEELFALNPEEMQHRFTTLLGRLAAEGDVHVLLSLRDDFLMKCAEHEGLRRVFSELTPLAPLGGEGLRRALVEPAKAEGFRFEDEALVEEMLSAVEGTRGALPLLAFAVSRLWEKRDREKRRLTRAAYEEIGGVAGALAQHAEAMLEEVGAERQGMVREVFRNLVTAQGTRAAADREEMLSLFPERKAAEEVLAALVDARLLTSYEVPAAEGEAAHHRVEIVHESLLKAWPRLVWWQAQDEEGARLRDQLRQAAHLWDEKGRTRDLLWTGTAYREFEVWRERYPGALTALEGDFAKAMHEKAQRRKRLVRAAAATVVLASTGVTIAIGVSGHQAVLARQRAEEEARRAEASKVLALAQLKLHEDPTEALAYATASLELADTKEARVMALRALQEAPPAWEVPSEISRIRCPAFSPDGHYLAVAGLSAEVGVWRDDGRSPLRLPDHETSSRGGNVARWASDQLLVTGEATYWSGATPGSPEERAIAGLASGTTQQVHVWSLPGGTKLRAIDFGTPSLWQVGPGRLFAQTPEGTPVESFVGGGLLRSWRLPDGEPEVLGHVDARKLGITSAFFEPQARAWLYTRGTTTHMVPLPVNLGADRVFSRHAANVDLSRFLGPDLLALRDEGGESRLLRFPENGPPVTTVVPKPGSAPAGVFATSSARWIRGIPSADAKLRLWEATALPGARPLELRREGSWYMAEPALDPAGRVVVTTTHNMARLTFWSLPKRWPSVVDGYQIRHRPLAFSPDSRWLATSWADGRLRLWPVSGTGFGQVKMLGASPDVVWFSIAFDPRGRYLFATGNEDNAWIVPLDGSPGRRLPEYSKDIFLSEAAVSPTGRHVATAFYYGKGPKTLRLWDVEAGAMRLFELPVPSPLPGSAPRAPTGYEGIVTKLAFLDDSTLYTAGHGGIRRWSLETGAHELVKDCGAGATGVMMMSGDRRVAITRCCSFPMKDPCNPPERLDLATGVSSPLGQQWASALPTQIREQYWASALPQHMTAGLLVMVREGNVQVARHSDSEVHLLTGNVGLIQRTALSPDLRWVASTGEDNTLRLWPMPDLSKPPLHTVPREELLAKVKLLTNLRAVRDPKSATGWSIELGPFPGWKEVPTW